MHWKGHLRDVRRQPAACSSDTRVLSRLALCSHVLSDSHHVKNRKEWQWGTKVKRQIGIRPPCGETFEMWPRLTSNPPAVGSCDALASWGVRSQSAAAPAPAAAPGYSWDQNKTVQPLKAQPVFMKAGLNTDSLSFFFLTVWQTWEASDSSRPTTRRTLIPQEVGLNSSADTSHRSSKFRQAGWLFHCAVQQQQQQFDSVFLKQFTHRIRPTHSGLRPSCS